MGLIALSLLLRRLVTAVPIILCVSALVFVVLRLLPADPIAMSLPPGATAADVAQLRAAFGLDRSIPEQFLIWLGRLARGDFGLSIHFRRPVLDMVVVALPATLELLASGLLLGIVAGVAGGLVMFAWRGTAGEQAVDLGTTVMMSIPEFLWAILLILGFGVALAWLPFIGRVAPSVALPPMPTGFLLIDALMAGRLDALASALIHLILPSVALAIGLAPLVMRVLRSSLLDVIGEDYIALARLRGLSERRILLRHALKNAALPTLSLIGVQAGFMFGGTVLVEVIFAYPGLGNLMVDAVRNHDLPVIQAAALTYCVLVLAINAVVDVLYLALNPKLRVAR
jgi:peptide/nickel transport system permease protein